MAKDVRFSIRAQDKSKTAFNAVDRAQEMTDVLTGVLDDALQGNIRSWRDLGRVAINVLSRIIDKELEAANAATAGGGVSLLGKIFGLVGGFKINGPVINDPGPQFMGTGSVGLASSGSFAHGGRFTVGGPGGTDRTPVRFNATRSEEVTIRTRAQQRAARSGGGFTFNDNSVITIDNRGADPGSERRLRQLLKQNKEETKAEIRDLVERGGRFSQAFGV